MWHRASLVMPKSLVYCRRGPPAAVRHLGCRTVTMMRSRLGNPDLATRQPNQLGGRFPCNNNWSSGEILGDLPRSSGSGGGRLARPWVGLSASRGPQHPEPPSRDPWPAVARGDTCLDPRKAYRRPIHFQHRPAYPVWPSPVRHASWSSAWLLGTLHMYVRNSIPCWQQGLGLTYIVRT